MRGNRLPTYDRLVLIRTPDARRPAHVSDTTSRYSARLGRTLLLLCFAFVMLCGYAYWQHRTISSLNRRIYWLNKKGIASATAHHNHIVKPTANQVRTIICPLCRGEKFVVYGDDLLHRKRQSCPVCLGIGYRTLEILPKHRICPDCHGMGIVYDRYDRWHAVRSADCTRCGAKGLIATFEQVGENAMPP